MSDLNGVEISDVLGLSQPITKLIETISCGVGKIYEPIHVKRMAKAKAKEIALISSTINENFVLPITYQDGSITVDSTDANALVQRAQSRFLFQEMNKQQNIEAIIGHAYRELDGKTSISDLPVDADWVSSFFNAVANVSTEQMQMLWGKLLAGEVERPGSFSLRTLQILKTMTQDEAIIFREIAPFILSCKGDKAGSFDDYFLLNGADDFLGEKYKIPFVKILKLSEVGLLSENSSISFSFEVGPGETELIKGVAKAIEIKNLGDHVLSIQHSSYVLTEAGKELFAIIFDSDYSKMSSEYLSDCMKEITAHGMSFDDKTAGKLRLSIKIVDCS